MIEGLGGGVVVLHSGLRPLKVKKVERGWSIEGFARRRRESQGERVCGEVRCDFENEVLILNI